ncbi:hypothetical protein [Robertmurraya kyonggiensis]|nr:hypothetical protein [Robertmurraya kyonggiensis]
MSSNNANSNNVNTQSTPKPIGVTPRRETRAGERPSFQAPVPPKTK